VKKIIRKPKPFRLPWPKRPRTRADCANIDRPCPFVGCKYHLFLDIVGKKIIENGLDPLDMEQCCALDEAEEGGKCLEDIRKVYGLSRERIRQIIEHGLRKMRFIDVKDTKTHRTQLRNVQRFFIGFERR